MYVEDTKSKKSVMIFEEEKNLLEWRMFLRCTVVLLAGGCLQNLNLESLRPRLHFLVQDDGVLTGVEDGLLGLGLIL